jgi:SAM-dependent methyltransferase
VGSDYRDVYSRQWVSYAVRDVHPAESFLLEVGREIWHKARLLDLGVGAGRTTWVFGALAASYLGIDIVPRMIEVCREAFTESPRRKFLVGDAQDLSAFADGSFDVVLFSYNGIDHLTPEGRQRALGEIRRVLTPEGLFFFSSHNLGVFPHAGESPRWSRNPFRWPRQWCGGRTQRAFLKTVNAAALAEPVQRQGWAILPDGAHGGSFHAFYISPVCQKAHLEAAGFRLEHVLDVEGRALTDLARPSAGWWLHYLCRPVR